MSGIITGGDANPKKGATESANEWDLGGNTVGGFDKKLGTIDDYPIPFTVNDVVRALLSKEAFFDPNNERFAIGFGNGQSTFFGGNPNGTRLLEILQNFGTSGGIQPSITFGNVALPGGTNANKTVFQSNGEWYYYTDNNIRIKLTPAGLFEFFNNANNRYFSSNNVGDIFLPLLPNLSSLGTDANGKIIAGSGGGGVTLTENQIAFGDATNQVTSSNDLIVDNTSGAGALKVGINNPTPNYELDVIGNAIISNTNTTLSIVANDTEATSVLQLYNINGGVNLLLRNSPADNESTITVVKGDLSLVAETTDKNINLRTNGNGFVGIENVLKLQDFAFASLPTGVDGMIARVNNSNTNTWGDVISGGGSNNVLAFFNGTDWTVFAK